jgi:hypothetical protein
LTADVGWVGFLLLLIFLLFLTSASAGEPAAGTDYGRVRHAEGSMTVLRAGSGTSQALGLNRPIVAGDRLESLSGRAEVVLADTTVIWVDLNSVVEFRVLAGRGDGDRNADTIDLRRGRLRIQTPDPEQRSAAVHVDTAAGSIYLRSAGSFRIEAEDHVTHLASFGGVAEFSGDEGSVLVRGGQSSSVPIHGAPTAPRRFNMERRDTFDDYHDTRAVVYQVPGQPGSAITGVPTGLAENLSGFLTELSFHGTWQALPGYGVVWKPNSAPGWGPFDNGFWERYPIGWVWVSAEPWGWAPYRYGRWDHSASTGWFWIPGTVWSGGWVAFAVASTHIGWCPLNFWNRPAFQKPRGHLSGSVSGGRLDPRGCWFAPIEKFGGPDGALSGGHGPTPPVGTSFVITRTLPDFDPVTVAHQPKGYTALAELVRSKRVPLPEPCPGAARVPFQVDEVLARRATRSGALTDGLSTAAPGCPPVTSLSGASSPATPAPRQRPVAPGKSPQRPSEAAPRAPDGSDSSNR